MLVRPFVKGASFDPEHVKAMGEAFDSAIRELDDSVGREVIAEQIIALAKTGERDPDKLCEMAMASAWLSCAFRRTSDVPERKKQSLDQR